MKTPKLKDVFESVFHGQVYRPGNGLGYDVPKLTFWCEDNLEVQEIPLVDLTMSKSDEKHGSKEFKKHAKKVDTRFPIVCVKRNDGLLQIADGNHRAWKAMESGAKTILGYIIPEDELPEEAVVEREEEKEDA